MTDNTNRALDLALDLALDRALALDLDLLPRATALVPMLEALIVKATEKNRPAVADAITCGLRHLNDLITALSA